MNDNGTKDEKTEFLIEDVEYKSCLWFLKIEVNLWSKMSNPGKNPATNKSSFANANECDEEHACHKSTNKRHKCSPSSQRPICGQAHFVLYIVA